MVLINRLLKLSNVVINKLLKFTIFFYFRNNYRTSNDNCIPNFRHIIAWSPKCFSLKVFVRKSSSPNFLVPKNVFYNKICCNTTDSGFYGHTSQNVVRQLYIIFSSDNRVAPNFFVEEKILVTKKLWEEDCRTKHFRTKNSGNFRKSSSQNFFGS